MVTLMMYLFGTGEDWSQSLLRACTWHFAQTFVSFQEKRLQCITMQVCTYNGICVVVVNYTEGWSSAGGHLHVKALVTHQV